eukprot:6211886-Pleurochrysis_carterae.AAC.2
MAVSPRFCVARQGIAKRKVLYTSSTSPSLGRFSFLTFTNVCSGAQPANWAVLNLGLEVRIEFLVKQVIMRVDFDILADALNAKLHFLL